VAFVDYQKAFDLLHIETTCGINELKPVFQVICTTSFVHVNPELNVLMAWWQSYLWV